MKKPIFTALSPNSQPDDVWLALKLICKPWRWKKGPASQKLQQTLHEFLRGEKNNGTDKQIFLFESGRTALYTLLSALNLQSDDEVLLQAYTCVAVPEPILWAGAKPVYVDIDAKTLNMAPFDLEKKISPRSKVLIIQHTFGQPANLKELLTIARRHQLFIIEDCAHSLGSLYEGKKVGTFADASFYSFGRDKVISAVFGGALSVNDQKLRQKIHEQHENYTFPSRSWIVQQLIHPVILGIAKATYSLYLGKLILKVSRSLKILSKAVYAEEKKGEKPPFIQKKLPNALAMLALHQFKKIDSYNRHRQAIAKIYEKGLTKIPVELPPQTSQEPSQAIYLRYCIKTPNAKEILEKAKRQNIYLGDWYTTGIAPEGVNYQKILYNPNTCPVAEQVAKQSLNLPTNIHITSNDAERIIQFLKNFYGTTDSRN